MKRDIDTYIYATKHEVFGKEFQSLPQYLTELHQINFDGGTSINKYKAKYPGSYEIEEYLEPTVMKFVHRLKFNEHQDKTMFLLRYA